MTTDSETEALTRRERERRQREEDFLRAAETLFSTRGFHATTMEDIARVAEYGTGTIYRYFESKDTLYRELFRRKALALLAQVTEAVAAESSASDRLCAFLRAKIAFFRQHQAFLRIFTAEILPAMPAATACLSAREDDVCQQITSLVRQIFVDGMEAGEFRRTDPDLLTAAFRGFTTEPLLDLSRRGLDIDLGPVEVFMVEVMRFGLSGRPAVDYPTVTSR